MARTDSTKVAGIIELDANISLDPFIEIANSLTTEICTGDNGPSPEYEEARLEIIERFLTAHFYSIRDSRTKMERAGPVAASFEGETGMYLEHSRYGQQAMILDTNGGLSALNDSMKKGSKRKIQVFWAAKEL